MEKETFSWLQPGAWRKPCIVHVTMAAQNRQSIFGTLSHNGSIAYVEKTSLGWILVNQQKKMLTLCPEVKVLADKVMPDHHHMVIQVMRSMRRSIKEVVRGYMQGCKEEARKLGFEGNIYDDVPYYRVLTHKGQLRSMINYVYANAERAWQRKQNPFLFRMHRQTFISGLTFTSLGNHFLLDWADRQIIEISRNANDEYIERQLQHALIAAQNGAITYTAAISKGEQTIARNLREHGFPLVILLNDGFPKAGSPNEKYYKPGGVYFEACAKGRLLLLEPTEQTFNAPSVATATIATLQHKAEEKHMSYSPISTSSQRYHFIALNEIARILCNQLLD